MRDWNASGKIKDRGRMKYRMTIICQLQCECSWKLQKPVWSVDFRTLNCFGRSALVMFVALQFVRNLEHACNQDEFTKIYRIIFCCTISWWKRAISIDYWKYLTWKTRKHVHHSIRSMLKCQPQRANGTFLLKQSFNLLFLYSQFSVCSSGIFTKKKAIEVENNDFILHIQSRNRVKSS